jgi:hypothetical protein
LEHCSQWLKVVSKSINEVMINNVGGMVGGRGWGWERPANGGPSFLLEEDDVLQLFRKFDANRPGTSWYNCCLSLTIWYGQNVDMLPGMTVSAKRRLAMCAIRYQRFLKHLRSTLDQQNGYVRKWGCQMASIKIRENDHETCWIYRPDS